MGVTDEPFGPSPAAERKPGPFRQLDRESGRNSRRGENGNPRDNGGPDQLDRDPVRDRPDQAVP